VKIDRELWTDRVRSLAIGFAATTVAFTLWAWLK
jgi:hypothetical protein